MKHRNDIEGLRSLAIIPILLFHADFAFARGGFIGVDVFFVISGFLITSIIVRDLQGNGFSFVEFYRRRTARLLPALFAMLLVTLAAATLLEPLPLRLSQIFESAGYAAFFTSNFYFLQTSDYFSGSSEVLPFLHTWSLSVEEQFYLLYPVCLFFIYRWKPSAIGPFVVALTIGSFVASIIIGRFAIGASFYMLPSRTWELGLGAIAALGYMPQVRGPMARNAITIVAGMLFLASLLVITHGMGFPAPWALLPCIAAMLFLTYGEGTLAGSILSLKPVRYIGAISYSLYLWHWPIMALWRSTHGDRLNAMEGAGLIVASFIAGAVSYHLLERPGQNWLRARNRAKVVVVGFSSAAALMVVGQIGGYAAARAEIPPAAAKVQAYLEYSGSPQSRAQYNMNCFVSSRLSRYNVEECLRYDPQRRNVIVIGDSHSAQYFTALKQRFTNANLMQVSASGCLPLLETRGEAYCTDLINSIYQGYIDTHQISEVVMIARWREKEMDGLAQTIEFLHAKGIKVTLFGPTVEYEGDFPALLAREMIQGDAGSVDRYRIREREVLDASMRRRFEPVGVNFVSLYDIECPNGRCKLTTDDGGPMHVDYGHVTFAAAKWLVARIDGL